MAAIKRTYKIFKESYLWETITFWHTGLRKWSQTHEIILKVKIYMIDIPELWPCQYIKCFSCKTIRNIIVSTEDNSFTPLPFLQGIGPFPISLIFIFILIFSKKEKPFCLICLCVLSQKNKWTYERVRKKGGSREDKSYLVYKHVHTFFYDYFSAVFLNNGAY